MKQRTNQFRLTKAVLSALLVTLFSASAFAKADAGSCLGGTEWVTEATSGAVVQVSYRTCAPNRNVVRFSCLPSLGTVDIRVDRTVAGLSAGDTMTAGFDVDGKVFTAKAYGGPVPSGIGPVVRLKLNDPIIQALSDGSAAVLRIGETSMRLHLNGSKAAMGTLQKGCERRRRCPAILNKKGCGGQAVPPS